MRLIAAATIGLSLANGPARGDELVERRQAADAEYQAALGNLAQQCELQNLAEEAQQTLSWFPERDPAMIYVYRVDGVDPLIAPGAEELNAAWRAKLVELRQARGELLFDLSHDLARAGQTSRAMIGLTEVLREDPSHAEARRILGYTQFEGRWLTSYAARMSELGNVWDKRFGWLPKDHLDRYEKGERRFGVRWVSAEDELKLRRNIRDGWLIRTDHYKLSTNHSLAEGVRLAEQLEGLHFVFQQVFAGYFIEPEDLIRSFRGRSRPLVSPVQHQIVYFREREEYNQELRREQQNIDVTLGIYFDRQRKAFFFAGADQDEGTLYHEGTHQLFQEIRSATRNVGAEQNFWIIEGIAAYMESLTPEPGVYKLGGFDAGRVPKARERILEGGYYLPLAELVAMGKLDVQRSPDIGKIYTQSAGLATFLMHYDEGRYRDALIKYLAEVYAGRDDANSLARLTGTGLGDLDRQYHEFLKSAPAAAAVR